MSVIQDVFIHGYEERTTPKIHVVYRIEIQARVRSWLVWRRYSEFNDLHATFTKTIGAPPCPLPSKHNFSAMLSNNNAAVLKERKEGLERYLRVIVCAEDEKWREHSAFYEFLCIPSGRRQGSTSTAQGKPAPVQAIASSSLLDERLDALQGRLRSIRTGMDEWDTSTSSRYVGDVSASTPSLLSPKPSVDTAGKPRPKSTGLISDSRVRRLGRWVKEVAEEWIDDLAESVGMSESDRELRRRTAMVARLEDDTKKLMNVARQTCVDFFLYISYFPYWWPLTVVLLALILPPLLPSGQRSGGEKVVEVPVDGDAWIHVADLTGYLILLLYYL
ncbi:Sorting nexin-24 [Leucoagaricus sp. SymC.cos]|nr:Sorting nexin-24 [Leucoagaricus sp. SymC.cos]